MFLAIFGIIGGFAMAAETNHIAIFNEKGPTKPQGYEKDIALIQASVHQFDKFWKVKEAQAIAELFKEDGTMCTSFQDQNGFGQGGVKLIFDELLKTYPNEEMQTTIFVIRFLKPDVAVVSMESLMKKRTEEKVISDRFNWLLTLSKSKNGKWEWHDAVFFKVLPKKETAKP